MYWIQSKSSTPKVGWFGHLVEQFVGSCFKHPPVDISNESAEQILIVLV